MFRLKKERKKERKTIVHYIRLFYKYLCINMTDVLLRGTGFKTIFDFNQDLMPLYFSNVTFCVIFLNFVNNSF